MHPGAETSEVEKSDIKSETYIPKSESNSYADESKDNDCKFVR